MNSEYLSCRIKILRIMVIIFWSALYLYIHLPFYYNINGFNFGYHYFVVTSIFLFIAFGVSFSRWTSKYYQEMINILFWGIVLTQMWYALNVDCSIYNIFWMIVFLLIAIKSIFNLKILYMYGTVYLTVATFLLVNSDLLNHEKAMLLFIIMVFLALTYLSGYYEKVVRQWNTELSSKHGQILNHANEGFALHEMIFNDDGEPIDYEFIDMNKSFTDITGLTKEILGMRLTEILPESESVWIKKYGEIVQSQQADNFTMKSVALGKVFMVSAYPFREKGFVTLFLDISDQVKNQEKLKVAMEAIEKANLSKARFLRDVNHRLRTPLNGMMGMAQLFDLSEFSDENRELYNSMYLEMKHSRNIINQIAQYVQIEDMDFVITENEIVNVIKETIESFNISNRKRIVFDVGACSQHRSFFEKTVMQKILIELIDNALKYSSDLVEVVLSDCFSKERNIYFYTVDVIDYGKGISEEKQNLIFNELYHHDFVHIYKSDNNISLALCKHLAQNIGASLTVESQVSKMTKFTLSVPAYEQP